MPAAFYQERLLKFVKNYSTPPKYLFVIFSFQLIDGAPGTGRTQFVLQLAANCHIPATFNGLDGEALFIDTEGSFSAARLGEIAAGLEDGYGVKRAAVLAGTHVLHVASWAELLAGVYALPRLLDARPRVRLVVIDSITFPMHAADPSGNRTRAVAAMMQFLCRVAWERGLVVAVTNHLTTRVDGAASLQVPSLGEGFGHSSTYRLRFFWSHFTRCIGVDKTPVITDAAAGPRVPIAFVIEQSGLKSVDIKS